MHAERDVEQFKVLGFSVLRGVLSDAEVGELRNEVETGLRAVYGQSFGRNTRTDVPVPDSDDVAAEGNFLPLMADKSPLSQRLVADDQRLTTFASKVLGDCVVASPALATLLVGDTPWHNDGGLGDRWLRFNAYLQPATADSGALRIVPCSQHADAAAAVTTFLEADHELRAVPDALVAVSVDTSPGDVIAFDPRVHHSSWGGGPRLRWSIDFLSLPSEGDSQRRRRTHDLILDLSDWPTTDEWPTWSEWTAGHDVNRRAMVRKLQELGIF